MINLEYYKDEIVEKSKSKYGGRNVGCVLRETRNKTYNCLNPCSQCIEESLEWLLEEHKELIKLKQWEYDLLSIYSYDPTTKLEDSSVLSKLKENGHFKGVTDISMTLKEILDNCEVK